MESEKQEIEKLSQKIINEATDNPENCIQIFESTLLGDKESSISFQEYLNQLQKTLKKCVCQASWTSNQLTIHCLDCQKTPNSCICVNCFLKGNHQGHKIIITHSSSATCDCGDPLLWSPSGFCSDHPGPEPHPEQTQLTEETRIKLISICKAAFSMYLNSAHSNLPLFNQITDFLSNLVSIGDATRRCVCLAMQESFNLYDLYSNSVDLSKDSTNKLLKFLGSLTNDMVFKNYFTLNFFNDFPKFVSFNNSLVPSSKSEKQISRLYDFTFHASESIILEMIKKSKIDWQNILIEALKIILEYDEDDITKYYYTKSMIYVSLSRFEKFLKIVLSSFDNYQDPVIIEFVNKIAEIIVKKEFSLPLSRIFGQKVDDLDKIQNCQFSICYKFFAFTSKISSKHIYTENPLKLIKNFFLSDEFQTMDKLYKPTNEFNRSIFHRSVLEKNVMLSQCFPIHILAFTCLNLKEKKSLFDYVSSVTNDVETFLKNWALIPLRWIAGVDLNDLNLFVRNDQYTYTAFSSFKFKRNIKIKYVPSFAFIQTLLKSTKNVDDFMLMIISIYGFFELDNEVDNFKNNYKRQLLFIIFHFILSLIFDTLCVEKNLFVIHRLIVISEMMTHDLSIDELNSIWYKTSLSDDKFVEDLQTFASKITSQHKSKFHLTDKSQWHPLLPFLEIPKIIPLIQLFIDDNPDSLINFPEIPDDSKHLLFTPTLWALEYFILNHPCCQYYQIIHQLVFNTLIITSQNSDEYYSENKEVFIDKDFVLQVKDFIDLSEKLKKFTFNQFLKMKIAFQDEECKPKSIVDLIKSFGNIGFTVLTRLNMLDSDDNSLDANQKMNEELKKKHHERAKLLKMQIMANFNKKQKSFQSHESQKNEENNNGNESQDNDETHDMECGICHLENENDCFVYPALILKSPFASYNKWRFRNAKLVDNNGNNDSGLDDDFSNIPDHFESFNLVQICLHPVHSKCIQKDIFKCPSDRCPRNASIPIIADVYDDELNIPESVLKAAKKFISKAYFNQLKFAIYSLASQIEIIEMRHRSNPDCLDDMAIQAALRNIYLCILLVMQNNSFKILMDEEIQRRSKILKTDTKSILNQLKEKVQIKNDNSNDNTLIQMFLNQTSDQENENTNESESESESSEETKIKNMSIHFTPFMKYILSSLISTYTKVEMNEFINGNSILFASNTVLKEESNNDLSKDTDIINDLSSDYQMLQFLRCAAIFDHFALGNKITQDSKTPNSNDLIDWDAILSITNLCNHYNVQNAFKINTNTDEISELTLPMFTFIHLPKNFLDFIHPPYSAPILEFEQHEFLFCLLTGKIIVLKSNEESNVKKFKELVDFINTQFDGTFSIFLFLNGDNASKISICDSNFSCFFSLKSTLYVDNFGEKDIGMKQGSLLYLNESLQDEIIDDFISGKWTNSILI